MSAGGLAWAATYASGKAALWVCAAYILKQGHWPFGLARIEAGPGESEKLNLE